jgi:hypothetical protein
MQKVGASCVFRVSSSVAASAARIPRKSSVPRRPDMRRASPCRSVGACPRGSGCWSVKPYCKCIYDNTSVRRRFIENLKKNIKDSVRCQLDYSRTKRYFFTFFFACKCSNRLFLGPSRHDVSGPGSALLARALTLSGPAPALLGARHFSTRTDSYLSHRACGGFEETSSKPFADL